MLDHAAMLQEARDALRTVLPLVDALNGFIRSAAHRRYFCCSLPYVIYHYKREAIMSGESLGLAAHRRATVNTTCHDCGGCGKYTDQYGYQHPRCRRCYSTGTAKLDFVETELGDFRWLTPRDKAGGFHRVGRFDELPETEQVWQVNQPGTDLTPSQVAEHLCEIEGFFQKRPPVQRGDWHDFDIANSYRIWVGETPRGRCYMCGALMTQPHGMHGITTGRLSWSASVCRNCSDTHKGSVFDRVASCLPDELLTPQIRRWVASHPVPVKQQRPQWVSTDYDPPF